MYIDFFPLWFILLLWSQRAILVVIRIITMTTTKRTGRQAVQSSMNRSTRTLGSESQLSSLLPWEWDLGQLVLPSLGLSFLLKMERIIVPTCTTVLRIKTALYICPDTQKTL